MPTVVIATPPYLYFSDSDGNPLAGGLIETYLAGTTTPQATYTDAGGGTPNANPVVCDSSGRAVIFLDNSVSYKYIVKTSTGTIIRTVDNITPFTATGSIASGSVTNAMLANMAGNTVKVRAASTSGVPSDLAISASQLVGRGSTGDMAAITLGSGLSMSGTTLNAAGGGWLSDTFTYRYYSDDFIGRTLASATYASYSGGAGALNNLANSNMLEVGTGTTSTSYAAVTAAIYLPVAKFGGLQYFALCSPQQASDGTNRFTTRVGFFGGTSFNIEPTRGIYFRHVDNVNSNQWQCVVRNAGVETVINTAVAPTLADSTTMAIDHLRFEVNAGGTSIEFFIDNVSMGSITTNIPTNALDVGCGVGVLKSVGASNRYALMFFQAARITR